MKPVVSGELLKLLDPRPTNRPNATTLYCGFSTVPEHLPFNQMADDVLDRQHALLNVLSQPAGNLDGNIGDFIKLTRLAHQHDT